MCSSTQSKTRCKRPSKFLCTLWTDPKNASLHSEESKGETAAFHSYEEILERLVIASSSRKQWPLTVIQLPQVQGRQKAVSVYSAKKWVVETSWLSEIDLEYYLHDLHVRAMSIYRHMHGSHNMMTTRTNRTINRPQQSPRGLSGQYSYAGVSYLPCRSGRERAGERAYVRSLLIALWRTTWLSFIQTFALFSHSKIEYSKQPWNHRLEPYCCVWSVKVGISVWLLLGQFIVFWGKGVGEGGGGGDEGVSNRCVTPSNG